MSKKAIVIFLVVILVLAITTTFFFIKNSRDNDFKGGEGKENTEQEQATTEDLQNKIESAIRDKLMKSAP